MSTELATLSTYIEARKSKLVAATHKTMDPSRVISLAILACSRTPALLECTPDSIWQSLYQASVLGLEFGGPLGQAYIVPYNNKKTGKKEAQLQIGYKGLIDLARRSGHIQTIVPTLVWRDDEFDMCLGMNPDIKHKPRFTENHGKDWVKCYAVATMTGGIKQFEVMTREQVVEQKNKFSKAKDYGPWVDHFDAMALKTVIKRLVKFLPMSVDMAEAVEIDSANDMGFQAATAIQATDVDPKQLTGDRQPVKTATEQAKEVMKAKTNKEKGAKLVPNLPTVPPPDEPGSNDGPMGDDDLSLPEENIPQ